MKIDWKPIEKCRRQETVLVGHHAFKGWFKVATLNALGEWRDAYGQDRLEREPTHFAELDAPKGAFATAHGRA